MVLKFFQYKVLKFFQYKFHTIFFVSAQQKPNLTLNTKINNQTKKCFFSCYSLFHPFFRPRIAKLRLPRPRILRITTQQGSRPVFEQRKKIHYPLFLSFSCKYNNNNNLYPSCLDMATNNDTSFSLESENLNSLSLSVSL